MHIDDIIHVATEAGKIILENGGETYRVEQTITMICKSYGIPITESFVTPTGIMVSITNSENKTISLIRRINVRTVNLGKVAMINNLSRELVSNPLSMSDIRKKIDYINNLPPYSPKTTTFFSAICAGFFTLLFGGNYKDFFVALIIGALINCLSLFLEKLDVNSFLKYMLGGSLAAFIALLAKSLCLVGNMDTIIIGSIMILAPGIAITNAIRDTIAGDLVSGISRTIEALFIAIAIAAGTSIVFKTWFLLFGGTLI
ncbi:threonine/serine exporter family protein [Clostridium sp. CM028]|uniref:threonine/serine exporter family protein n=1 Tax=unclassified Clostridium TaxID=2614128 RepID=UPI001C0BE116|nr:MULTISPECIES: threonine/serine exporter family protein [unclassified Clostridium]MBU3091915.1 threonine/serine exporter family protein [Clostridium sp. CF011]MBW9145714.1 threonine/serine exporter family protein [Clostridium sp. CM027]MBW9147764.1 threonine/serine exporter family protein [Clostridium sp. CM028]UVE41437.1 threonine/serine exporter family protein [Clostridium sp. CM027]WAG70431.1 threonine/serine exporter family protein [Clostridium sp. CF011]